MNYLGTLIDDGNASVLPSIFVEKLKNNKKLLKKVSEKRKELFKHRTSVLKDNFYEGIDDKDVKKLKKRFYFFLF